MTIYALEYFNVEGDLELLYFNKEGIISIKNDVTTVQPEEPSPFTVFVLKPNIEDIAQLENEAEVLYDGICQISDSEKTDFGHEMAQNLIQNDLQLLYEMCEMWPTKQGNKLFNKLLETINEQMASDDEDS